MRRAGRQVSGALTGARTGWRGAAGGDEPCDRCGRARGFRFRFCPLGPARRERAEPSPPPPTFWALLPGTSGSRFTQDPSASRTLSLSLSPNLRGYFRATLSRGIEGSEKVVLCGGAGGFLLLHQPLPSWSLSALEVQPPQCRFHPGQQKQRSHSSI